MISYGIINLTPLSIEIPIYDPAADPEVERQYINYVWDAGGDHSMTRIILGSFQINHIPTETSYYFPVATEEATGVPIHLPEVVSDDLVRVLRDLLGD